MTDILFSGFKYGNWTMVNPKNVNTVVEPLPSILPCFCRLYFQSFPSTWSKHVHQKHLWRSLGGWIFVSFDSVAGDWQIRLNALAINFLYLAGTNHVLVANMFHRHFSLLSYLQKNKVPHLICTYFSKWGKHTDYMQLGFVCLIKGQLDVPLTVYPWYLLCPLGIFGDYNP